MPINENDLQEQFTKTEAAAFLKVSVSTVDRMIAKGDIKPMRVGSGQGRVRFTKRMLLDHLNGGSRRGRRSA